MNDDTPQQPPKESDGQGTDSSPDRAQPELTEQNLLNEQRDKAQPERRRELEGELEEMEDDIKDANSE